MKREIFIFVTDLQEKTIGKKRYLLRREVTTNSRTQYCIRDNKYKEIYKNTYRPHVEQYWEQYFVLLEKPCNPFKIGDIVFECNGKSKENYEVYQVINTTKTKVYLRKLLVDYETSCLLSREFVVPQKDCFDGEEIIEKQIEIINLDKYSIKLEYGIRAGETGFKTMARDKIWVGLD